MSFPIKKLLVFILLLFFGRIISQSKHFYNYENGLSNSLINEVFQDHLGFIWVATEDGLNRFDGIKFTTFTEEEHGLKANYVTTLTEDSNHNIWIGFINGLQKYNSDTETFTSVKIYIANTEIHPFVTGIIESRNGDIWIATSGHGLIRIPIEIGRPRYSTSLNNQLNSLFLRTIYEDQNGTLWLGSDDNGICTYAPATEVIKSYTHTKSANFQIPATSITSITGDKKGNIFIASLKEGLYKLNTQSKQVSRVFSPTHHKYQLPVKKIMFDSQNRLWVGTDGLGLYHYNQQTDKLIEYLPSNSTFDFSKSKIHCILEDHDGNIWTGIFQKGLYLFPETPSLFKHYGYRAFDPTSIGSSCVTALDGDALGLWIGTDGDGLYRISKDNNAVSHINLAQLTNDDANNTIFSLYDSNAKYLWIGTYSNGLIRYNKKTGNILSYKHNPQDAGSIPSDNIGCIQKGTENKLWIGTYSDGLISLNLNNNKFSKGFQIADSLNNLIPKIINDIYIDNHENIWLATYQGLVYFNAQNKSLSFYSTNNNFLPSNIIYCIHPDNKNNIWLGTYKGLVKINPANMSFSAYTKEDGIAGNVICAIQEDRYGQLWISTHTGLSRLNPSNNTFVNYYASDGLQSNEFYRNAVYKSADNSIYFGGINGVTEINKDYNLFISELPDIMLTNFMRFNTSVKIGTKTGKYTILNKSIVVADSIHLLEKDNVFSISFTSKELSNQSKINYEYMMEGFDRKWNKNSTTNPTATYTNLSHGEYQFLVRGIDKDKVSQARKLTIIIHPPWYKTNIAKVFGGLLAFLITFAGFQLYKQTFRRIEVEKMNEKKMQFFINISHEIRTPLSLIIDPLEKLISQPSNAENQRLFGIMHQNANRIFRLINQLMDVRKLDKGKMLVKFQETDLCSFISNLAESYNYLATSKEITLEVIKEKSTIKAWIDPLNFEKVITNLLSNAFKFTNTGGKITVYISELKRSAQIIVEDNGIGIKKTDSEKIFNRFYQVNSKETRNITGTGIGLHLSRSLVELHKGRLFAEPCENITGSRFIIQIPLGNKHLAKEDLITSENMLPAPSQAFLDIPTSSKLQNTPSKPQSTYKIMVVEDELEIRNYLVEELKPLYKVIAFENGKQAHSCLLKEMPDLILSDIMMPEMDGITFCKKVKNHIETNHIPIILLTALSKEEDKAEGIETGADMYLIKPFSTNFLKKSIVNLLENRNKIFNKWKNKNEKYELDPIDIQSHDEILIQKVMTIIRDNISNNDLNVEMLADGVGISRVHMHRKLKEITNQSARDLIKNVRMKQAAYILVNKKINVSEVAYSLGYSSLSHFSTTFKSYYGISPKEYAEQEQNNTQTEQS